MAASSFAFYRGGALIMANDLAHTPRTNLFVQACGDAHISNFGFFQSPERHLVFDLNDFDETLRGPWEWDLKRLAASIEICGRYRNFTEEERTNAVLACVRNYRLSMQEFTQASTMEVWYAHTNIDELYEEIKSTFTKSQEKYTDKIITKAKAKNSNRAVLKFTETIDGKLQFISQPPLIVPAWEIAEEYLRKPIPNLNIDEREKFITLILRKYRETLSDDKRYLLNQYHGIDLARKVVGVGSVGTRCWIVLLEGMGVHDPLVLQIKEAQESVLERFIGKSPYPQHGQRVVEGQRAIQATSDIFLGWSRVPGIDGTIRDFYIRQLWDGKGSVDLDTIAPEGLVILSKACGKTLARAHARTGNRFAIAGYLGKSTTFDDAIAQFAIKYADQNEKDYQVFMQAYSYLS